MVTIALIVLVIVAVVYMQKPRKTKENGVPYVCTRCEMMYYSPDIPLNSKCHSCGGGVQPY